MRTRQTSRGGRAIAATLASAALLLSAGCGDESGDGAAPADTGGTEPAATVVDAADERVKPTRISIPKLEATSSLIEVGMDENRQIEVPPIDQPMQAAWYKHAQVPGDPGPAVILGHVDGRQQPGIFYRLHELTAGDEILINLADGTELRFRTTRVQQIDKDEFPTELVYGSADEPELRLITCGGAFDEQAQSYTDNVIAYAEL
ncbi:class F sortase [Amycolatopsis aidingensis]|uniref:class F sortase n=1 Tax=Amycolatopsis aidingensis TaxID=2842453 RepID=UPI001C0C84BC|nr:class F sortase [Amycolatopsis aidingensis]